MQPRRIRTATFTVRFDDIDAFLVEYSDRLRSGFLLLREGDLEPEQPVRVKLCLPSGALLYLSGAVIDVVSEGEGGPGFLIELTRYTPEQERVLEMCMTSPLGERPPEAAPAPARSVRVLLVDDSQAIRKQMRDSLLAEGFTVSVASNGLEAMSAALKEEPEVILTDVEMPVMDGWTLLRMIRARKKLAHLPVVFLTSLSDDMSRLQGYRLGVDEYLPKTLPPDMVIARLRGVLRRSSGPALEGSEGIKELRGGMQHVQLASVLSFLENERKTGELHVESDRDYAVLCFAEGRIVDVRNLGGCDNAEERMFELLSWREGQFEFRTLDIKPPESGVSLRVAFLLMEQARREDEASRDDAS
ncbi:MAG: response regulator [Myxococcales bacterium]|nr:response regulator [Myxococcales bacterium]